MATAGSTGLLVMTRVESNKKVPADYEQNHKRSESCAALKSALFTSPFQQSVLFLESCLRVYIVHNQAPLQGPLLVVFSPETPFPLPEHQ